MKSTRGALAILSLALCVPSPVQAKEPQAQSRRPHLATAAEGLVQTSAGHANGFKAAAGGDTFCLYGGPGSLLGKFQDASGLHPDAQGWTTRDVGDQPTLWQLSTFRSPTGTQAMWAGRDASQEPGWADAPGYGNSWNALLVYRRSVSNSAQGQTVGLNFTFNHDTEPGYDFFNVEYDSAGITLNCFAIDGYNQETWGGPSTPLFYPDDVSLHHSIVYAGNDYSGAADDEIVIRMTVTSDGAWSDQDGLWPSVGAAQVDDITVTSSEGVDFEDFESGATYWIPQKAPYAGDFCKVFRRATDLDPCREDTTPLIGFIDDGTPVNKPDYTGAGIGTTSVNWSYGIPGGWVLNYNGGVSFGSLNIDNEWWSPEIDWDLPGTADDGAGVAGAFVRFGVYQHVPLINGFCWTWSVRGRDANTGLWSPWDDRNFFYYSNSSAWLNVQQNVGDLLPVQKDRVQMQLAVRDIASIFAFPGTDATPAPLYDNASFQKFSVGGPTFATRTIDLFGDSFSQSGLADVSTPAARDLLDCRVDMARSVSTGALAIPGDSMICNIGSIIPGVAISDPSAQIKLHYSLSMNPVFESALRGNAPLGSVAGGRFGWDQSEGSVAAYQSTTSAGNPVANRFAFDLPDVDFMYPGDILEFYIEAIDDDGRTSTLPADLSGFGDGSGSYSRIYTMRALPTYSDTSGDHPDLLFWNDFGHRGAENEDLLAFDQLGMQEGVHFDTYTTKGPSSLVDNGLGSAGAHGATAAQIAGYSCILYESGDLSSGLISNGTDTGLNDKGNDVGLLTTWFNDLTADRFIVHFGDNLSSYMYFGNAAQISYLSTVMGVTVNASNVRNEIGNQTAPRVLPLVAGFNMDFAAYGGCLSINQFDSINAGTGAVRTHGFEIASNPGTTYAPAAGVVWDRLDGSGNRKVSVTFPYAFHYVHGNNKQASARSVLLGEVLDLFGVHDAGPATDNPASRSFELHANYPNPFNPQTRLSFTLGRAGNGSVRIYNVRGELVRRLAAGNFGAGLNTLEWNGRDDTGTAVASGVYVVKFDVDGFNANQKIVMVK